MSFPEILSAQQLVQQRQSPVTSKQFILFNPNDVVWQTQPDAQVDGALPYAEFDWDGTDQGSRTDVNEGMTVLISTSSDYRETTIFRGRVRKAPDATTFFINETSVDLEVTDFVTVIDDYDIHEKQERREPDLTSAFDLTGLRFIDWDKTFETLPPLISNLQSTYVDISGDATVDFVFTPTVTAVAAGASENAYEWIKIGDGTIIVGTSADKDVTIRFPGSATNEHRWVLFRANDTNGVIQYFVFEVYTVDLTDTSSVVFRLDTNAVNITGTRTDGFNVTGRVVEDFDSILDRTRCTIISVDSYNGYRSVDFTDGGTTEIEVGDTITGASSAATAVIQIVDLDSGSWAGGDAAGTFWINQQSGTFQAENLNVGASSNLATIAADSVNPPITQNVSFIGRVTRESDTTRGDETFAKVQESQIAIEGFATQLNRIRGPGVYLVNDTAPTEWGEINTMTVGRAAVYMLAWYSTFLNICSFTLPADIHDFDWPSYSIQPAPLRNWIDSVVDDINAFMIFAASGECEVARHASYAGTGGLDTIIEFKIDSSGTSDTLEFNLNLEYIDTHTSAIIGAATYDTALDKETIFQGRAPAQVYGPGWETTPIDQQIMKSDLTEAQAKAEAGSRVGSHLAFTNPKARLNVRLPSGYYWLVPADHQLYAFAIAVEDSVGGRVFTSSDKWLCVEVSYVYDADSGSYEVSAVFEEVTTGGNFGITVTQIVNVTDLTFPDLPPLGAGLGLADLQVNFPDLGEFDMAGIGAPETGPGDQTTVPPGCEVLNLNFRASATQSTTNITQSGETYTITVRGDATISSPNTVLSFFNGDGNVGWSPSSIVDHLGTTVPGIYDASLDAYLGSDRGSGKFTCNVQYDPPPGVIVKSTTIAIEYTNFGGTNDRIGQWVTIAGGSPVDDDRWTILNTGISYPPGRTNATSFTPEVVTDTLFVHVSTGTSSAFLKIRKATVTVTNYEFVRGDAFYMEYTEDDTAAQLYSGGKGLLFNAVKPGNIPQYNSEHIYELTFAGTGGVLTFSYNDEDGNHADNDNRNLIITICGPGMAQAVV